MDRYHYKVAVLLLLLLELMISTVSESDIRELDLAIQASAFQRLAPLPRTGVIYNVTTSPSSARVQAVRLRSGSLRRHGLVFNEFNIPVQSLVETSSKYVVLIYRSFTTYPTPVPAGYALLGSVVGIKAYEANDLSVSPAQELTIFSGSSSITVLPHNSLRTSLPPLCAAFDKEGVFRLSNVSSSSSSRLPVVCPLSQLVDSALAVEADEILSPAPSPAPAPEVGGSVAPAEEPVEAPSNSTTTTGTMPAVRNGRRWKAWKVGVGVSLGGLALAALVVLLGVAAVRTRNRARIARMEHCADNSESLQTALIGGSRAPAAAGTRTRPVLETDYLSP